PKLLVIRAWKPCADAAARSDSPALTTPSPPEPASPTTRSSIILVPRTPGLQELQHARGLPEPMQGAGLRGACEWPRAPAGPTRRPCAADAVHARTLRLRFRQLQQGPFSWLRPDGGQAWDEGLPMPGDAVHGSQELPHGGEQGDLRRLSAGAEPLV